MIQELTIAIAIFLAIFALLAPRKYLTIPFILAACFVPTDQRILVMDLNFTVLRILVLIGLLRLAFDKRRVTKWNSFDKMVMIWAFFGAIIYCIQWSDTKAMINRSGVLFDILGLYFIFRENLSSRENIIFNMKIFAACSVIMAAFVAVEYMTGNNPFVALGSVVTVIRVGRYRCQGPFPHSIMMGLFWTGIAPILAVLSMIEKNKILYMIGLFSCAFIVFASASSTPIVVFGIVMAGLFFFNMRRYAGQGCFALIGLLIALHIVMSKPVWHLISRINIVGGSTGWHRFHLIDEAINHFNDWMLIGCQNTAGWGMGLEDITNQFVLEGVRGGFLTLLLFIFMLFMAFKIALDCSFRCETRNERLFIWSFFVALVGHCVGFLGVSYFGQIMMLWYMMLAIVRFLSEYQVKPKPVFGVSPLQRPVYVNPEIYTRS